MAHDPSFPSSVITNRFIDGLKKEIKSVVMVHRPQDLDSASSLALLQEEALLDQTNSSSKKGELNIPYKNAYSDRARFSSSGILSRNTPKYSPSPGEDRRIGDSNRGRSGEDKLATLKNYRKAKGLCFKCGEKWNPGHKCQAVSLHAMEEVWEFLFDDHEHREMQDQPDDENDSGEELTAISVQAIKGIEGVRTIRLRGFLAGQEVFMLIDSGSTNSFISEDLASRVQGRRALSNTVLVKVAIGSLPECTHELPDQLWNIQGCTFKNTFKIIPVSCYDVILGMDWLESTSPMQIH